MAEQHVGWPNFSVNSNAGRVRVVLIKEVSRIKKRSVGEVSVLMKHRAQLNGLSKTLSNQIDPLLYGGLWLVGNSLSDGFEGVLGLRG